MSKEVWKNIVGYETKYQVSNKGNVRNSKTKKLLKLVPHDQGYIRVTLSSLNKKLNNKYVHRLVLEAFKGISNHLQCNHIDYNKKNNALSNLEWVTPSQNTRHNTIVGKHSGQKLSREQVLAVRNMFETKTPVKIIANLLGVSSQQIYTIIKKKSWSYL